MGGGYGLAYFGVVQVDGITPQKATPQVVQQTTPPVQNNQAAVQESQPVATQQTETPPVSTPEEVVVQEQSTPTSNIQTEVSTDGSLPAYGLNGTPAQAGNDGFTIGLFTLSSESNARNQGTKLNN